MSLLVLADSHIGSGANLGDRLADQRSSWLRVCTTAAELGADVIGGGDFMHYRKPSALEVDVFQAGLRVLREGGRTFVSCSGNGSHEGARIGEPNCLEVACAGFDARVLREPGIVETSEGVVAFLPWMIWSDARETSENLMIVAESLAEQGARMLVGHWALSGGSVPNGTPTLDLPEPVLDSHRLSELFDVSLLGHIHKRQETAPNVWHMGALCRVGFGDRSESTGAWQVDSEWLPGKPVPALRATWFEVPDRPFISLEFDERDATDPTTELIRDVEAYGDFEGAIVRIAYRQTAEQVVDQRAVREHLLGLGAHHIDALSPLIERQQSVRSQGVTEQTGPHESWDAYFKPQAETLGAELAEVANERAHERIAGAASC